VFMNLIVQDIDLLSSAILIPVSQPLVICSEESGRERHGCQVSFPICLSDICLALNEEDT
jgi:hypothetical protein